MRKAWRQVAGDDKAHREYADNIIVDYVLSDNEPVEATRPPSRSFPLATSRTNMRRKGLAEEDIGPVRRKAAPSSGWSTQLKVDAHH